MSAAGERRPLRVLVAAGGTVGHLAPALVVADCLRERGHHVVFAVSSGRSDERVVAERGYELHAFPIGGLPRRPGPAQLRAIGRAVAAVVRCVSIVRRVRPDVVLGGGGFVSAPAAIAARLLGTPVVVTEADAHLGLANRIAARVATRLCSAYPLEQFADRQLVTGRPVSPAFFDVSRARAREMFGIGEDDAVLAVVGGSGGATRLNDATWGAFAGEPLVVDGAPLHVLHVTGRRDRDRYDAAAAPAVYRLIEYCDDVPALFAAADVVVSRAGGSVFELAAVGRAAILVPFPHATGDHQRRNAKHFADRGAAVLVDDVELAAPVLRAHVEALFASAEGVAQREQLAQRMHGMARPDAARAIADAVEQAARPNRNRSQVVA